MFATARRSRSAAAVPECTPIRWKTLILCAPVTSAPSSGSGQLVGRHVCVAGDQYDHDLDVRAQTGHFAGNRAERQQGANGHVQSSEPLSKEDPTFKTHVDPETNETIIEGMGELHLDIYVERMKREYNAEVTTGNPRVAYRETITTRAGRFPQLHA